MIGINNFLDNLKSSLQYLISVQYSAEFIIAYRSWTCHKAGVYRICALGGGGGGGCDTNHAQGAAGGGGGGGFCQKELFIDLNTQLTIVIGSGGVPRTSFGPGNSGGQTTVSGININLIANGGTGGETKYINAQTAAGGFGGGAFGGDLNYSGGNGGNVLCTASTWNASGGGASGSPYGNGGNGGNITYNVGNNHTGGGSVGEKHANNKTASSTVGPPGTGGYNNSGKGINRLGFAGPAENGTSVGLDGFYRDGQSLTYTNSSISFDSIYYPFLGLSGGPGGSGAGSATCIISAGVCGGQGGLSSADFSIKQNSIGGGGGGYAQSLLSPYISAGGGNGLVTIELIGVYTS
jgi:hypothetical protein